MLEALLRDLAEIPGLQLQTTRDRRLPPLPLDIGQLAVGEHDDAWQVWERCIREADAVWLIAPESGGLLERLSILVQQCGKCLLGSRPTAVALTASKRATSEHLLKAGLQWVPTYPVPELPPDAEGAWVLKPDDGVGCEQARIFADLDALLHWQRGRRDVSNPVAQPYLDGTPASLCVLCREGRAWLLSCNRQQITVEQGGFVYHGSVLNDLASHWEAFGQLAAAVARAIPDLAGYIGIDVIVSGTTVTGLEVNPRLTTSYAGLRRATGRNPARMVLDLLYNNRFDLTHDMMRNVVPIALDD